MTTYEFMDEIPAPGKSTGGKKKYNEMADACKANPGRWTVVQVRPADKTANVRTFGNYIKRVYGLETKTRLIGDECILYASYQNGAAR